MQTSTIRRSLALAVGLFVFSVLIPLVLAATLETHEPLVMRRLSSIATYSETSVANTQLVVTVNPGKPFRLIWASVKYSGAVSVSFTSSLDSHVGAAYDVVMDTVVMSSATTAFIDPTGDRIFRSTDAVLVTAPAGGSGVTAAVAVQVELIQ